MQSNHQRQHHKHDVHVTSHSIPSLPFAWPYEGEWKDGVHDPPSHTWHCVISRDSPAPLPPFSTDRCRRQSMTTTSCSEWEAFLPGPRGNDSISVPSNHITIPNLTLVTLLGVAPPSMELTVSIGTAFRHGEPVSVGRDAMLAAAPRCTRRPDIVTTTCPRTKGRSNNGVRSSLVVPADGANGVVPVP